MKRFGWRAWPWLVLLGWALLALFGARLAIDPNQVDLQVILQPPGAASWFGADDLGRPVAARLIAGAGTAFRVAFSVILVSATLGSLIGALAAWHGGWLDRLLSILVDLLMAFPGILLAIALASILGPGLNNLVIALSVVGWVGYARLARAQILSLKTREHVLAAKALGVGESMIILRHLLPLAAAPLLVEATFGVASVVVAEAGLSFLGLGIQPPDASWGSMIRDGARYMLVAPHLVAAPGLTIFVVVLAVNIVGDRLRDAWDPRSLSGYG